MISPFLKKKKSSERPSVQDGGEPAISADVEEEPALAGASEGDGESAGAALTAKSHMDKKSLDLIFAVEQIIQDKQRTEASNHELQDRLSYANGYIERLNKDLKNLNKVIEDREKSIAELERKLAEKNLKVDQMLEDYRELQSVLSDEIEELKSINEIERQKYDALQQKNYEIQAEKNKRIAELEEKIGKLEVEHAHMKQKFEAIRQEKTYLVNMVNDFTARMTTPFAPKSSADSGSSPE